FFRGGGRPGRREQSGRRFALQELPPLAGDAERAVLSLLSEISLLHKLADPVEDRLAGRLPQQAVRRQLVVPVVENPLVPRALEDLRRIVGTELLVLTIDR